MNFDYLDPTNYGVVQTRLDDDQQELVWNLLKKYSPESAEWSGNTLLHVDVNDKQWSITDDDHVFENTILRPVADAYFKRYGLPKIPKTTKNHGICFNRFWCRASTRHDYQSLHDHKGIFTFVIWMKIPVNSKLERADQGGFRPEAGEVCLTYIDTLGTIQKMNFSLCPKCNGQMILFPSEMNHVVWPHHSTDEWRISVAGDISFNSDEVFDKIDAAPDPSVEREVNPDFRINE